MPALFIHPKGINMIENTTGNMNEGMTGATGQPTAGQEAWQEFRRRLEENEPAGESRGEQAAEQTAAAHADEKTQTGQTAPVAAQEPENEYLIKFSKPYTWEGKEYTELDMSGLKNLTIRDAVDAQKRLISDGEAAALMLCETTTAFTREIACKATGKPIEFFKFMPVRIAKAVASEVQSFIASKSDDTSKLVLRETYSYSGRGYKEIAIDGLGNLNSLNMSEAENALTREGFIITATQFNYLYACVILGMATGLPTEFYTGLPLSELTNVKNAANNSDFFE